MLGYNDLYELLRKEKYSESLQPLPKKFIADFVEYIADKKETAAKTSLFSDSLEKSKKQLENSISLFKELTLLKAGIIFLKSSQVAGGFVKPADCT